MNSTGVKVNNQELRNAEFFGEFKTAAYELSTEQLDRWRGWNVFTPNQIARMDEVELTSEFMLLIMNGVLSKRKPTIDSYYSFYDEIFPDRKEVGRRIHLTFDQIESLLPRDVIARSFSSRTLFYALFVTVYGMQFGIRTPAALPDRQPLKREKAQPLKGGLAEQLKQAALSLRDETAPPEVLKVARGAVTDASARRIIIEHLAGAGNSPCPPLP